MKYTLKLNIKKRDLKLIRNAGLKIIVAKAGNDNPVPNVNWIVIDPFEHTLIMWDEIYGLYASALQALQNGTYLEPIDEKFPVTSGAYYTFTTTFEGPFTSLNPLPVNTYQVNNNSTDYPVLVFGLEQTVSVNNEPIDSAIINATLTLSGHQTQFSPLPTIWVWLQSGLEAGTINTQLNSGNTDLLSMNGYQHIATKSNVAVVSFGKAFKKRLKYDFTSAKFIPAK